MGGGGEREKLRFERGFEPVISRFRFECLPHTAEPPLSTSCLCAIEQALQPFISHRVLG